MRQRLMIPPSPQNENRVGKVKKRWQINNLNRHLARRESFCVKRSENASERVDDSRDAGIACTDERNAVFGSS